MLLKIFKHDLETFDFTIMIENLKDNSAKFRDYDSELLLKILNKTSIDTKNSEYKEFFVDEDWKINAKNMRNIIPSKNSNLKRILSEIFPEKKILIQDNNDGSQMIFLS